MPQAPSVRPIHLVASSWLLVTLAVLMVGFREAIFRAPTESTMGDVQRVFYYHLPAANLGLLFPFVNFAASLAFLYWRRRDPLKALSADALAVASAEVTLIFTTICLGTGMLWGKASWGIWWAWDARLTTLLLLWLLYVAYLVTRRLSSTGQTSTLAAVLSVFAAVDVPIVFMSIRWWRTQHPAPVFESGKFNVDHGMLGAIFWNLAGWAMWGIFICGFRYAIERRRQLAEQDAALNALEASMELTR